MATVGKATGKGSTAAYVRGYVEGPRVDGIFGENVARLLKDEACNLWCSEMMIVGNLLGVVSSVVGPSTKISMTDAFTVQPNLFLVVIAPSSSGKSQAFRKYFYEPVRNIESSKSVRILLEDFTPAGLNRFLEDNKGYAAFAADEFCHVMQTKLSSRHTENMSFRSDLNKYYNGRGGSKQFATKASVQIPDVYLTVFGCTQPQPYASLHAEIGSIKDGLMSRFLLLCPQAVPPKRPANPPTEAVSSKRPVESGSRVAGSTEGAREGGGSSEEAEEGGRGKCGSSRSNVRVDGNWVNGMISRLYDIHHGGQPVVYKFSNEAWQFIQNLREASLEAKRAAYELMEEKIKEGCAVVTDVPEEDTEAKDFEYVAKLSVILHILSISFGYVLEGKVKYLDIPMEVGLASVEKAQDLVMAMRSNQAAFTAMLRENVSSGAEASQVKNALERSGESLEHAILSFPGKVISSSMVVRKCRHKASAVCMAMKRLHRAEGEAGYVGQFKHFGNKNVFYKASIEKCDMGYLESTGVSQADYVTAYNADMSKPPCSGLTEWDEYYKNLLDNAPDGL